MSLSIGAALNTEQHAAPPHLDSGGSDATDRLRVQAHAPSMLQIVELRSILLHEAHDPARTAPLEAAIVRDEMQRHPVILANNRYGPLVHLDGANRIAALTNLGCRHVAAQIVDYADPSAVTLDTWLHLTRLQPDELLAAAKTWHNCALESTSIERALDMVSFGQAAAVILFRDETAFALVSGMGLADRVKAMQHLISLHRGPIVREAMPHTGVLPTMRHLLETRAETQACIAFATLTKADVITLAWNMKALLPSGITRHIISCGRVLNINVPLALLQADLPTEEKTAQLHTMLSERRQRVYIEPIVAYEAY